MTDYTLVYITYTNGNYYATEPQRSFHGCIEASTKLPIFSQMFSNICTSNKDSMIKSNCNEIEFHRSFDQDIQLARNYRWSGKWLDSDMPLRFKLYRLYHDWAVLNIHNSFYAFQSQFTSQSLHNKCNFDARDRCRKRKSFGLLATGA